MMAQICYQAESDIDYRALHTLIRDLLAVGATQHTYVLNPYAAGGAHSRAPTAADVFTSRFVGTAANGHNLWLPQGLGMSCGVWCGVCVRGACVGR